MTLKELLDVIDPNMEGIAWIDFRNNRHETMCKANTCSSFLAPFYPRKVEFVAANGNEFKIYLEGEI